MKDTTLYSDVFLIESDEWQIQVNDKVEDKDYLNLYLHLKKSNEPSVITPHCLLSGLTV